MNNINDLLIVTLLTIGSILLGIVAYVMKIFSYIRQDGADKQKMSDRIESVEKENKEIKLSIKENALQNEQFRKHCYKAFDELKNGQNDIRLLFSERLVRLEVGGCEPIIEKKQHKERKP